MSFHNLYRTILNSQWMMHPEAALKWYPIVHQIQTGKFNANLLSSSPRANIVTYLDQENQNVQRSENGYDIPEGTVAVIQLPGEMIKYGNLCAWGADEISQLLWKAHSHPNIVGIVLDIDSPGGAVNAISPFVDFMARKTKPVVALADMCASAGYYVAAATDHIMASNTISAWFGSIGTMISFYDMRKYLQEKGIEEVIIYADQSTHKNKPFNDILEGIQETMKKEVLNPLAQNFMDFVKQKRGAKLNTNVEGIINGRMFFAEEAKKHGLIDSIGNLNDAINLVRLKAEATQSMFN